ncbi:hypothetical protein ASAP_0451 [Asaia bogorensis]|uniref:Uncharacterized protein n=1 Tax=Asaia bogorensis TaxID=91915 RepID=A0A060QGV5_9PROT|nr:hypothetical protein ASAP_0451 [Asaia bogorensis]
MHDSPPAFRRSHRGSGPHGISLSGRSRRGSYTLPRDAAEVGGPCLPYHILHPDPRGPARSRASPDLRTVEGDQTPARERNTIAQRGSAA